MYFISYKCVVGEVDNYFQLAVTVFFWTHLIKLETMHCLSSFLTPPFHKSGSAPAGNRCFPLLCLGL